jgi:TolA-binding protein
MSAMNYAQGSEPKKDNRGLIYGVLVAALLGTWGYIIYDKSKTDDLIQSKDVQYASLDSSRNMIQLEYENALLRLDELSGQNTHLDSLIRSRDTELSSVKQRINQLVRKQNASTADLTEARRLIEQLNGKIDGYIEEIERLQGENLVLTQDKRRLTSEKAALEQSLSSTQTARQAAEVKVDVASTLHASNFSIVAVNERNNGKERTTSAARRADKFRISFQLDENRVAPSGEKDLYIIVFDPSGKLVTEQGLPSGNFQTREDGDKLYSNRVSVTYEQGQAKLVSFDLRQADKYQKGNYKVEVYHNGFRIGENTVQLK